MQRLLQIKMVIAAHFMLPYVDREIRFLRVCCCNNKQASFTLSNCLVVVVSLPFRFGRAASARKMCCAMIDSLSIIMFLLMIVWRNQATMLLPFVCVESID